MVKKISGGIGGVLKIVLSAIALYRYVPYMWDTFTFYLNFSNGVIDSIPFMYIEMCFLFAGFAGQIVIGLSELYGLFRENPLSRSSRIAIDLLLLVFAALNFSLIYYWLDEETMLEFICCIAGTMLAALDMIVLIVCSIKAKDRLFSTINGVRFVRGLQIVLIPAIICCTIATMHGLIAANIKRDSGKAALRGGFDSFTMQDMDGNEYTEDMFRGHKITMMNFWGTFCHPCIGEMPELQEISEAYDSADFQLVGVTCDVITAGEPDPQMLEIAQTIVDATGVKYPILIPSPEMQYGVIDAAIFSLPHTIFFNENGEQVLTVSGARNKDKWIEIIEEVIANEK